MTGTAGREARTFEREAPGVLAGALATALVLGGVTLGAEILENMYPAYRSADYRPPYGATCTVLSATASTKKNIPAHPRATLLTATEKAASASSTRAITNSTISTMSIVVPTC